MLFRSIAGWLWSQCKGNWPHLNLILGNVFAGGGGGLPEGLTGRSGLAGANYYIQDG